MISLISIFSLISLTQLSISSLLSNSTENVVLYFILFHNSLNSGLRYLCLFKVTAFFSLAFFIFKLPANFFNILTTDSLTSLNSSGNSKVLFFNYDLRLSVAFPLLSINDSFFK